MDILWVGFGGAVGAILRWGMTRLLPVSPSVSLFAINVLGSFLMGLIVGQIGKPQLSSSVLLFLTTGLLGAFTTFSTFSLENMQLLEKSQYGHLAFNIGGQVILGIIGVMLGKSILS
ncbi:MAG: CrcB family protein [Bacteriovoracaceae bacterium]|nr:CrcB family protein [Bacteriovoracaceae bacterium]